MQQLIISPILQKYSWTKELPNLIQALSSKNEEEVTVARKSLVFNFASFFERLKNAGEDTKILGDLLDEVTKLLFPIYSTDAGQKGSLLSEIIDLAHLITDGRRNETTWLTPLYRLFSTIYDYVDPIIERIQQEDDPKFIQGCCYLMGNIKMQDTISNNKIIKILTDLLEKHDNDQIRACAIMSLYVLEDRMADNTLKSQALKSVQRFFNDADPSLSKLAAAIFTASASVPKLSPVIGWYTDQSIIHLQHLDEAEESMTSLIKCIDLFFEVVLKDQIEPGMNVADLPSFVVRSLETLVKMNKIWDIDGFNKKLANYGLEGYNTRDLLVKFIADKQTRDEKIFPTFNGLDEIDWSEIYDAYGPATTIPDAIRKLASNDVSKRKEGFDIMYSNVVHQGSLFPVAQYVVPFLIEILDCTAKPKKELLSLIRNMLFNDPDQYLYTKEYFSLEAVYPDPDEYSELVQLVHDHVTKNIKILFNIILNDAECAGAASKILQFLEHAIDLGAIPILKEAIEKHSDWTAKGELLWSLSFLYPRVATREECLGYFMKHWKQAEAEGALNLPIAAGLARFYFDEDEAAPKFLVDKLLAEYLANDGQHSIKILGMIGSELAFPALLQKCNESDGRPRSCFVLVETLLAIAFKFERYRGKPVRGSALKPHQIALLQTIVDKNTTWIYVNPQYQLPSTLPGLTRLLEEAKANTEIDSEM